MEKKINMCLRKRCENEMVVLSIVEMSVEKGEREKV